MCSESKIQEKTFGTAFVLKLCFYFQVKLIIKVPFSRFFLHFGEYFVLANYQEK